MIAHVLGLLQHFAIAFTQLVEFARPIAMVLQSMIVQFGGFISGCIAFPFQLLFGWLRALGAVFSELTVCSQLTANLLKIVLMNLPVSEICTQAVGFIFTSLRNLVGLSAPAKSVVSSVSFLQSAQMFWTQVLRPIKASGKSIWDSSMMILVCSIAETHVHMYILLLLFVVICTVDYLH